MTRMIPNTTRMDLMETIVMKFNRSRTRLLYSCRFVCLVCFVVAVFENLTTKHAKHTKAH